MWKTGGGPAWGSDWGSVEAGPPAGLRGSRPRSIPWRPLFVILPYLGIDSDHRVKPKRVDRHDELHLAERLTGVGSGVKLLKNIRATGSQGADHDRAEHRSQALGPPFVDVIDRPIYFFPPTLPFRDRTDGLEWKCGGLDCPHFDRARTRSRRGSRRSKSGGSHWVSYEQYTNSSCLAHSSAKGEVVALAGAVSPALTHLHRTR